MATGAGAGAGERMPPGLEAEADTNTSTDSAVNSGNTNVVTPPPCSIPPGLMPPEETAETALTWLRRTEVALASAAAPPPKPEEFVRGREFRDVCVEEFWSSGGAGAGGAVAGGGAADRALARHERAERARKRRRGVAGEAGGGGNVNGEDEEEEDDDSSSSSSSMSVLASILASVRRGCGLSFVDLALLHSHASPNAAQTSSAVASLSASHRGRERQRLQKGCQQQQPVVEIRGASQTGKTTLVLTMAANYVANTAVGCYLDVDDGEDDEDAWAGYGLGVAPTARSANNSNNNNSFNIASSTSSTNARKRKGPTTSTTNATARVASTSNAATPPAVVILDSDLDVHPTALVAAVRSAVLRRWGETGAARRSLDERRRARAEGADGDGANEEKREDTTNDATSSTRTANDRNEEWRRIQSTIRDALGRIHVVRTASGEGLFADGIPALESLRRSLDLASASAATAAGGSASASSAAPPTLLLIDSLTSSDRRDQRLEAVGTGLSGRNEFYRQLRRLRAAHPVAVVATATGAASTVVTGAGTDVVTPWSKMVTARVGLERRETTAAAGEKSGGYEYKALVPCAAGTTATPAGRGGGGSIVATVPFKIDRSGIWD